MGAGSSVDNKASEANQEQPRNNNNNDNNNNSNSASSIMTTTCSNEEKKEKLVPLPHNHQATSQHVDPAVDRSLTDKVPGEQLLHAAGVSLKEKIKEKYRVEKDSNRNCFMLSARDLSITWAEDERFWHWPLLKESSNGRDLQVEVAELRNVCWLEVHGKLETGRLTPGTVYRVAFVVQLKDPAYGWEVPVNVRLVLPDGSKQERKETLMEKPRGKWIEIEAGEIRASPENLRGEIEFSMFEYEGGEWKKGLLIKGVQIKPKASFM